MGGDIEHAGFEGDRIVPTHSGINGTMDSETDHSRSEQVEKFCVDFGVQLPAALEIFEWFEEHLAVRLPGAGMGLSEQARNNKLIEFFQKRIAQLEFKWYHLAKELCALRANDIYFGLRRLLWRQDERLVDDALNHENPAIWAREQGISKEMSYRLANALGTHAQLPKREDQRSEESCERMSVSRTSQLHEKIESNGIEGLEKP